MPVQNQAELRAALSLSDVRSKAIASVVDKLDQPTRDSYFAKLSIVDGCLKHTYYRDVENALSAEDFRALYEALGYDFTVMATWKDWRCGHGGCVSDPGWSCNPDTCT